MNEAIRTIEKRKEPFTFNLLDLLVVFYMAHRLLPTVGQLTPGIVFLAVFGMTALMLCISKRNRTNTSDFTKIVFVFSLSVLGIVERLLNDNMATAFIYVYGQLQAFLYGWIALYYVSQESVTKARRLLKLAVAFYAITISTTYIGNIVFPQASRLMATFTSNDATYKLYTLYNIGGFSFVYEVALLVPLLVYFIKSKRLNKVLGTVILVVIGMFFLNVEYTAALVLFLASVSLLFVPRLTVRKVITIVVVVIILALLLGGVVADLLDGLSDLLPSSTMAARLDYFAKVLRGEDVGETEGSGDRMALYSKAINEFIDSKFMGTWGTTEGSEHSFILDSLAKYGIIGIGTLLLTYTVIYKGFVGAHKSKDYYPYLVWMYIMALFLAVLNPKLNQYVFIFMIPLFARVVDYYKAKGGKVDENSVDSK